MADMCYFDDVIKCHALACTWSVIPASCMYFNGLDNDGAVEIVQ